MMKMRLIDADELKEELLEYEITIKRVNKNRISKKEQAILLDINAIVTNSPTVIENNKFGVYVKAGDINETN